MIGIPGVLVIALMAGKTILRSSLIDVVHMTGAAVQGGVGSKQRIENAVIKDGPAEARIGYPVTVLADRGEPGRNVVWVLGGLIIVLVAADTGERTGEDVIVQVALFAVECPVPGVEQDSGSRRMVEAHGRPGYRVVALFAIIAQLCAEGIVLSPDPVTVVTAVGRSLDFPPGVAGIAIRGQVPALKREGACLVKGPGCILEAGRRVAETALRAESSAMWVLMTRSAMRIQGLFKYLFVALIATEFGMSAGQIETGIRLVMVILRGCRNGVALRTIVQRMAGDAAGAVVAP